MTSIPRLVPRLISLERIASSPAIEDGDDQFFQFWQDEISSRVQQQLHAVQPLTDTTSTQWPTMILNKEKLTTLHSSPPSISSPSVVCHVLGYLFFPDEQEDAHALLGKTRNFLRRENQSADEEHQLVHLLRCLYASGISYVDHLETALDALTDPHIPCYFIVFYNNTWADKLTTLHDRVVVEATWRSTVTVSSRIITHPCSDCLVLTHVAACRVYFRGSFIELSWWYLESRSTSPRQ
jgi:hypothetical protein